MDRVPLGSVLAQRNLILVMLLAAAAACWIALLVQASGGDPDTAMASPTGMGAPLFLAVMNITAMLAITLIVFAEKAVAWRRSAVYGTATVLMIYGCLVLAVPRPMPTFAASSAARATPGTVMPTTAPTGR